MKPNEVENRRINRRKAWNFNWSDKEKNEWQENRKR